MTTWESRRSPSRRLHGETLGLVFYSFMTPLLVTLTIILDVDHAGILVRKKAQRIDRSRRTPERSRIDSLGK